jgi:Domain of unknown function (DUF4157)
MVSNRGEQVEPLFLRDQGGRFEHGFSKIRVHSPTEGEWAPSQPEDRLACAERGVSERGIALPARPRSMLEAQFGVRFDDVRLHTSPSAIAAARQLHAAAYTLGSDIAFGDGFYAPDTDRGLRLLSHELTHVVQSRATPKKSAEVDKLFEATEPLEQEAKAASAALGQDRTTVRQRLRQRMPLCHPIYISSHGEPGYLAMAAKFYADWRYSPIKQGVPSIEEVIRDLASQSSIEHITIVSHAESVPADHVMMEFINDGPDTILKSDWEVTTIGKLTELERHLVDVSTVDTVIQNVEKAHPGVLGRIGSIQDPVVRQFIWWVLERVRATRAGYPAAAGFRIETTATEHAELYRNELMSAKSPSSSGSASGSKSAPSEADIKSAEDAVVAEAKRWPWDKPPLKQEDAPGHEQRLKESPSTSILRVMRAERSADAANKPEFFENLAKVQKMTSASSWIEIQGCRAGKDKDYLKAIQRFFGGTARVTAPDWYQVFGHFGWKSIPDNDKQAQLQWESKDRDVPGAFKYWFPIIAKGNSPRHPTYHDLLDYLRAGHVLPLAYPGVTSPADLLFLRGTELPALLAWLARHQYLLTKEADIQRALFHEKDFGTNVQSITVDWLAEQYKAAGQIALRPSPEYAKHIISAN